MRLLIIALFLILNSTFLFSQTNNKDIFYEIVSYKSGQGSISIVQSSHIKDIVNMHVEGSTLKKGISGYRIQVYSGSSKSAKNNALQIISNFRTNYKHVEPHLSYNEPNFKVRVGDFRTKSEALKFMKEIKNKYNTAFIIQDFIDFPKIY